MGTSFFYVLHGREAIANAPRAANCRASATDVHSGSGDVVVNPTNHLLFVSTDSTNPGLVEVNPNTKTFTTFKNINSDGLTISADGSTLYAADVGNGHILGFDTTTGAQMFDSGFIAGGVDGTTLGFGSLAGNIFVNTNAGTLVEVNLATDAQTLLGTGGSRGEFRQG